MRAARRGEPRGEGGRKRIRRDWRDAPSRLAHPIISFVPSCLLSPKLKSENGGWVRESKHAENGGGWLTINPIKSKRLHHLLRRLHEPLSTLGVVCLKSSDQHHLRTPSTLEPQSTFPPLQTPASRKQLTTPLNPRLPSPPPPTDNKVFSPGFEAFTRAKSARQPPGRPLIVMVVSAWVSLCWGCFLLVCGEGAGRGRLTVRHPVGEILWVGVSVCEVQVGF